jgi:uncharacterized protein
LKIEQTVEVDAPLDRVWALVNDVPRVAPCMPGGALTKVVDERTYEGTVLVKLGPIRMNYKGTVVLESVDEANHSAVMSAKGRDVKGSGTASANVTTRLEADGDNHTRLHVSSDVQLTGKVASFGRGAVQDVAAKLFGQFADCLRETLDAETAAEAGAGQPPATPTEPGKPVEDTPEPAPPAPDDAEAPKPGVPPATPTTPGRPAGLTETPEWPAAGGAAQPAAPRESAPLEVGGLVGTVVVGRLKAVGAFLVALVRGLYLRLSRRA